jgi:hypothetical protein
MANELVPRRDRASNPVSPGNSALTDFLKHTKDYLTDKAVMPADLVRFGLYGAGIMILAGLIALALPDPSTLRHMHAWLFHAHFFVFFRSISAGLDGFAHALAVPAIVCGVLLLVLDAFLTQIPTTERWRLAVVGQAAAGGVGAGLGVILLALFIINLAIWIVLTALLIAACGMALFALLAAIGGG